METTIPLIIYVEACPVCERWITLADAQINPAALVAMLPGGRGGLVCACGCWCFSDWRGLYIGDDRTRAVLDALTGPALADGAGVVV